MQDDENTAVILISAIVVGVLVFALSIGIHYSTQAQITATKSTEAPAPVGESIAKIYFEIGSAELPAEAGGAIETVKEKALANPVWRVLISGFHDISGDPAQNAELAKQRALSAKAALIAAGVPEDRILLRKPQAIAESGDMQEARRVDIHLQ